MKTPRELLLKKHAAAQPKLDAISRGIAEQCAPNNVSEPKRAWRWTDWLWPSPVAWGGVAAAWLVVIGFNIASRDAEPQRQMLAKRSPEMLQALREQRQLFVELVTPSSHDAEPVRPSPRPRSNLKQPFAMA